MAFGYQTLYANGLNSNTQIRRSVDMIYQRGATYEVVLTGTTFQSSMELDVDLYSDDEKVGRMSVVPYNVTNSGGTYTYRFNIRPYDYLTNYVNTEHYKYYWLNDWYTTSDTININRPYKNIIKANFKYGYKYLSGTTYTYEYSGSPTNDLNHYTAIPSCAVFTGFTASGFTNTGEYFDYVGGTFQFNEKFYLPNFDQELGTVIGTGLTINTLDTERRLNPMSQFLMDYPTLPEESETSRFLTEAPRIQYIQTSENYVLYYIYGQTGDRQVIEADYAVFEFFDDNNNRIDYVEQQLNFSGTTYASPTGYTDTLAIFALPCGPIDINNIYSTIDYTNVAYYRVQLFAAKPTQDNTNRIADGPICPVSETFYFYLYDNCLPENTRIAWLNSRGGYDYYTFQSYRQDTKKISRTTFDNRYYATNISSPDRDFGRTVKTFDTDVQREIVLETDFLTEPYANWIEELFYSPQVYEMKDDFVSPLDRQDKIYKDLRPLQILSTEVINVNKKHSKLNKYRITLKYADSFFVNKGF
jgi:hypothetical protein